VYAKNKLDRSSNGTVNCRHGETDAENMKWILFCNIHCGMGRVIRAFLKIKTLLELKTQTKSIFGAPNWCWEQANFCVWMTMEVHLASLDRATCKYFIITWKGQAIKSYLSEIFSGFVGFIVGRWVERIFFCFLFSYRLLWLERRKFNTHLTQNQR
jgi:hypothetical protein